MTRSERLKIINKVVELKIFPSINDFIECCILDELMFAGLKHNVKQEFEKVIQTYTFEGYNPSQRILNYISHYTANPELAALQHYDLNDCISYIGEYYDGTPTHLLRKKGRFEITPITID